MITTIVFDMDDTLYLERDYCYSGFRAVGRWFAHDKDFAEEAGWRMAELLQEYFDRGQVKNLFNTVLDVMGVEYDNDYIMQLVKVYREHAPNIRLSQQNKTLLQSLHGKYKLALLSDGFLPAQQLKANALELDKYIDCILFTEELGREFWKPSTRGFEVITEKLNVSHSSCVYVGDNRLKDFIGPNQLGFTTIYLEMPGQVHNDPAPDKLAEPDYTIASLQELTALLEAI